MRLLMLWITLLLATGAMAQTAPELPRRAALGFTVEAADEGLRVRQLAADSHARQAGLEEGDLIVAIEGRTVRGGHLGRDMLRRLDGNRTVDLRVRRGGDGVAVTFTPPPQPFENFRRATPSYGALRMPDGAVLRTIVTRPEQGTPPFPAIFFTQWVSCDSVEIDRPGVWLDVMRGVIERSGMAFIRVERSSGGDSEGPGCHELDYDTEVAHYRHAFDQLIREPLIDTDRVYIWGNSLGSTTAPLVAVDKQVAGIIVDGGGAQTYYERMLQFDRIGFEHSGMDPREIDDRMRRHAEFHVEYLLRGRAPEEVVRERPQLADVWQNMRGTGDGIHYGRPYAYHQQAARKSFLQAWAEFEGKVLVLYHEYDQFEYGHGHRLIVETLNRLRPDSAAMSVLPSMGHDFRVYPSRDDAVNGVHGAPAPELAIEVILRWLAIAVPHPPD